MWRQRWSYLAFLVAGWRGRKDTIQPEACLVSVFTSHQKVTRTVLSQTLASHDGMQVGNTAYRNSSPSTLPDKWHIARQYMVMPVGILVMELLQFLLSQRFVLFAYDLFLGFSLRIQQVGPSTYACFHCTDVVRLSVFQVSVSDVFAEIVERKVWVLPQNSV